MSGLAGGPARGSLTQPGRFALTHSTAPKANMILFSGVLPSVNPGDGCRQSSGWVPRSFAQRHPRRGEKSLLRSLQPLYLPRASPQLSATLVAPALLLHYIFRHIIALNRKAGPQRHMGQDRPACYDPHPSPLLFTSQQCPAPERLGKHKRETRTLHRAQKTPRQCSSPTGITVASQMAALPLGPTPQTPLMARPTGRTALQKGTAGAATHFLVVISHRNQKSGLNFNTLAPFF